MAQHMPSIAEIARALGRAKRSGAGYLVHKNVAPHGTALEKIGQNAEKETVSDGFGRIIVARRLTTSQQVAVREMAASGDPAVVGLLTLAASVESVDGAAFP